MRNLYKYGRPEKLANIHQIVDWESQQGDGAACSTQDVKRIESANRLAQIKRGYCPPMYAVVCRTFRQYGGPEEGGWYYDHCQIEECRRAWDFRGLLKAVRDMRETHPTDQRGRGSVLGNENQIEGLQSTERPTYE